MHAYINIFYSTNQSHDENKNLTDLFIKFEFPFLPSFQFVSSVCSIFMRSKIKFVEEVLMQRRLGTKIRK